MYFRSQEISKAVKVETLRAEEYMQTGEICEYPLGHANNSLQRLIKPPWIAWMGFWEVFGLIGWRTTKHS